MTETEVRKTLSVFFPKSFEDNAPFLDRPEAKLIIDKIKESPVTRSTSPKPTSCCTSVMRQG